MDRGVKIRFLETFALSEPSQLPVILYYVK
jgi:hypothetical protein